jgi:hypothetical protein
LPVGNPIGYAGTGAEQLPWGPTGIAISEDDAIWIGDGVNHRVLRFDRAGNVTMSVELGQRFIGIGDVETFGQSLVVST